MAKNPYQSLVSSKSSYCKGKTTKASVRKKASSYVKHAGRVAKKNGENVAKALKSARSSANRVLRAGCKTSTVIAGKRKKKGAKKRRSAKRK